METQKTPACPPACTDCDQAGCACVNCRCSVQIRGLGVKKKDTVILHDVDLSVGHGEILALIGRNGAGKTTLLKALLGRIPYTGEIRFTSHKGENVAKPKIGYVPQNLVFDHSSPLTVADMLCANLSRRPVWLGQRKAARAHAEEMLRRAGAAHNRLDKRLGTLSGGELQRVLLAFALDPIPDLLLLDEPVSAVDRRGIEVFYELVSTLRERYHMPVILVSHDLSHVRQYATTAALLDRTIRISGPVADVMDSREVRETFGLPAKEEE